MSAADNTLNTFITDIYGTIVEASKWNDILAQTVHMAGAKAANICLIDHVATELNSQFMCPETTRFYPVYMQSPHMEVELQAVSRLPSVISTAEFVETGEYVRKSNHVFIDDPMNISESEEWLYQEWSIRTRYISRLNIQPSYLDLHTILFDEQPEAQRLEGIRKIEMLTPHFAKAVELSRPFLLLKSRFQATLDVLDRFHLAVFVLSPTGAVVLKNNAANRVLDYADAVTLDAQGKLRSSQAVDSPNLAVLIDDTLRRQNCGDIQLSTELMIRRRSGKNPYLAEITPLSEPTVLGPVTGLMVIMIDPDHRKIINTNGMQQMFSLSNAETHICQLLVEGLSTTEIADSRNVSPITVKNQIKALLSKTGNRNRIDLIRQVLSINLPVDQPDEAPEAQKAALSVTTSSLDTQ